MAQPFIPRDKPKSWIIFIYAVLLGLLVFGPLLFIGGALSIAIVSTVASFGFVTSWLVGAAAWIVFMLGLVTGKYRNVEPRPWKEQVW